MAQVNSVSDKRTGVSVTTPVATGSTSKSQQAQRKGQPLSRRERDQYRFIKRALRESRTSTGSDKRSSLSEQQFIQNCFAPMRGQI